MKILYAEDEPQLSVAVTEILKMEGYDVDCAFDGAQALEMIKNGCYDAAVLDIMMPKLSGTEVLKSMRDSHDYTPVLMLTAKATTDDKVEGLSIGADDYLGKPFAMKELLAHLKSMLRRNTLYKDRLLTFGNSSLDCETGELKSDRGSLRLSGKESRLLALFFKHPGYVFSLAEIYEITGDGPDTEETALLYLSYLKNKLAQICADCRIAEDGGYCLKNRE